MVPSDKISTVLLFLNSLHRKDLETLEKCFNPRGTFQDILPNGTIVKSSSELLKLHIGFIQNKATGFRPFDWTRNNTNQNIIRSEDRSFIENDLESLIEFDSGYFCRVAAEVDRPTDFREVNSEVARYYMHLGLLIKNDFLIHVQNTPFNPLVRDPR